MDVLLDDIFKKFFGYMYAIYVKIELLFDKRVLLTNYKSVIRKQ